MSRYIDADEYIKYCDENWIVLNKDAVNAQPTADVVEVVRCKDCRYHENEQMGMVYCPAVVGGWVEENWFCKGGEREDE